MSQTIDQSEWKRLALAEVASVKEHFCEKYEWELRTVETNTTVTLFVRLRHKKHPDRIRVLKLTYGPGFPQQRPRESFVNPDNFEQEGVEFWIDDGNRAFKVTHNPPVICLEGTWGFHHKLHRERDPLKANLNKLLVEIQKCYDKTP